MTSLQILILSTIQKHGPQSDMALLENTRCESLAAVMMATATLEEEQFIEHARTHRAARFAASDPVTYWQLTPQGRQTIAGMKEQQEQEVPRCS